MRTLRLRRPGIARPRRPSRMSRWPIPTGSSPAAGASA